jgi:hypothetical protein
MSLKMIRQSRVLILVLLLSLLSSPLLSLGPGLSPLCFSLYLDYRRIHAPPLFLLFVPYPLSPTRRDAPFKSDYVFFFSLSIPQSHTR